MADDTKTAPEAPAASGLGAGGKIAIVVVLAAAVAGVVWLKSRAGDKPAVPPANGGQVQPPKAGLPRLIDLGRGVCIPCKMMVPVLEALKTELAGKVSVEYIDIGDHPEAVKQHRIQAIPTQIFLDAAGKELFRHEGFYPKEDILAKWKELGVDPGPAKAN